MRRVQTRRAVMAASRPCEQCGKVRRCGLHLDQNRRIVYLCGLCAKELGYLVEATGYPFKIKEEEAR
jgi:hypothetical protein